MKISRSVGPILSSARRIGRVRSRNSTFIVFWRSGWTRRAQAEPDATRQLADALAISHGEAHQHAHVAGAQVVLLEGVDELLWRVAAAALLRRDNLSEELNELLEVVIEGPLDSVP